MFCWNLFFPSRNLRAPWADRRAILHDARKYVRFYNTGPKFWGCLPQKILGAKSMQNLQMNIFKIGELLDRQQFLSC